MALKWEEGEGGEIEPAVDLFKIFDNIDFKNQCKRNSYVRMWMRDTLKSQWEGLFITE